MAPQLRHKPMYVRCMLLVPKNLVYVFILVIVFAFCAMSYITYTEADLKDFVKWGKVERKEFQIHDFFKLLQRELPVDTKTVAEESAVARKGTIDAKRFNVKYLS